MLCEGDLIVAAETLTKLCFIGGGSIALSVVKGLKLSGFDLSGITVVDRHQEKLDRFSEMGCKTILNDDGMPDIIAILRNQAIILAVKPDSYKEACKLLWCSDKCQLHQQAVISLMAGIKIEALQKELGGHQLVIRAMPNICVEVGAGVTQVVCNMDAMDYYWPVRELFGRIGMTL